MKPRRSIPAFGHAVVTPSVMLDGVPLAARYEELS